ncbi:phosphotransferase family protein [Candidatus Nucleicultrix amoebiphila]|jgi:aminoglycoside phosphotransferase (APT) family kinase protein|uniref:Aminoglycoside phosphotransferase domain-containing protein n=1 Tax=Candidatus Nucleicultrix amoebiphila FS5 TaxID=1414854 RepID=A0A1W6N575_9PROT|nr:aminoglycoside phosphotransferase family protein [Candidatus Nucleicultrix amoebiphila]ARN85003.1 hypothetical protein GQ61_06550 [Candidatus Nucleicultrix amoebiphila FS5]
MDDPILKSHWERFKDHVYLDKALAQKLLHPFIPDTLETLHILSEGCANTNYKVSFKTAHPPVVIRIYVREKSALKRELAIHKKVAGTLPVPHYLYADDSCSLYTHPYAIVEWIEGIMMRDIVLQKDEKAISECTFDAGLYLNELRHITLPKGGFFQEDFQIRPFQEDEKYLPYVTMLLNDPIVIKSLGPELHHGTQKLVRDYAALLPFEDDANLTHGDYDPANMLVKEVKGVWKIAAILDWEFSFAGPYLLDIGMMLRYSHKLPKCYEESFIKGIESSGNLLPQEWKRQAKLMDLLCLLQLIHHNPYDQRPKMNRDVVSLVTHTVSHWAMMQKK